MTDRAQVHGTPHRPPPGPPVEVILWRITPKAAGRGERRDLIDNVKVQSWEHLWRYRYPGPGRYRAEFRDDRRQIVKVEYFNAMPPEQGGQILQTKGRHRPSKRSIPPPVDAWDDRTPNQEMRRQAAQEAARAPAPRSSSQKALPEPPAIDAPAPRDGGAPLAPSKEQAVGVHLERADAGEPELRAPAPAVRGIHLRVRPGREVAGLRVENPAKRPRLPRSQTSKRLNVSTFTGVHLSCSRVVPWALRGLTHRT